MDLVRHLKEDTLLRLLASLCVLAAVACTVIGVVASLSFAFGNGSSLLVVIAAIGAFLATLGEAVMILFFFLIFG